MPIYEYKCDECDHQLEKLQKISDDPARTCPECGKDGLRKLVSAAAFKLKGTGWYETDFKDKKPAKDKKTDKKEDKKPSDAKTTKTEDKKTTSKAKSAPRPSANQSSK